MDDRFSEIKLAAERLFSLMEKELLSQREEIEHLKELVEKLQKEESSQEKAQQTVQLQPKPQEIAQPIVQSRERPQPKPEEKPHVQLQEKPQTHILQDDSFTLDDDLVFEVHDVNDQNSGRPIIGELFVNNNSVADYALKKNQPWMVDMPGPKVNTIEEALSLNDRMFFVRELFGGDDDQFDLTLERINETSSFKEVINDMRVAFPEWDETSNGVYRFYMVVRRKFRD